MHEAKTDVTSFLNAGYNRVSGDADAGWSAGVLEALTSKTAHSLKVEWRTCVLYSALISINYDRIL